MPLDRCLRGTWLTKLNAFFASPIALSAKVKCGGFICLSPEGRSRPSHHSPRSWFARAAASLGTRYADHFFERRDAGPEPAFGVFPHRAHSGRATGPEQLRVGRVAVDKHAERVVDQQ
jgi:hypothetical protein